MLYKQFYQDADTSTLRQLYVCNISPHLELPCRVLGPLSKEGHRYARISSEVCFASLFKTVEC